MRALLALTLLATAAAAREPGDLPDIGFDGLAAQRFERQCFGTGSVHYDPALASPRDDFIEVPEHPAGGWRVVLAGRLGGADAQRYELRYDDGPSCDPTFSIWKEGAAQALGEFGGDHVVVPGNGFLYVIRRSNRAFEGREKWQLRGGELVQVTQPQMFVGVDTRTRREVRLRQQPGEDAGALATVPAGERVRVVLQQEVAGRDWYLVRTPFGLVGWTRDDAYGEERAFEDLQYLGD